MNERLNFNNCYVLGPKGMNEDKIIVERTTILDEDMSAEVIDRVEGNIHNLEFRIPRGKSGTSNNPTYEYKFSDVGTTYNLEVLQGETISLNRISDFKNIITDIENDSITLSIKSRKKVELTSAPDINAYVIIIKIA